MRQVFGLASAAVPGRLADITAVRGNTVEDITAMRQPVVVMKGGRVYRNDRSAGGR